MPHTLYRGTLVLPKNGKPRRVATPGVVCTPRGSCHSLSRGKAHNAASSEQTCRHRHASACATSSTRSSPWISIDRASAPPPTCTPPPPPTSTGARPRSTPAASGSDAPPQPHPRPPSPPRSGFAPHARHRPAVHARARRRGVPRDSPRRREAARQGLRIHRRGHPRRPAVSP